MVVVEPLVESMDEEAAAAVALDPEVPVVAPSDPILLRKRKSILVGLSEKTEEVCKTKIRQHHRPQYGHSELEAF